MLPAIADQKDKSRSEEYTHVNMRDSKGPISLKIVSKDEKAVHFKRI